MNQEELEQNKIEHPSETEFEQQPSFLQTVAALPPSLQSRCLKQFGGGVAVSLLTLICLLAFKQWPYCIGFLFAGYIFWIGVSIARRYATGQIVCKKMQCISAKRILKSKEKLIVAFREIDAPIGFERGIHQYIISTSARSAALLSENVLVNVYFDISSPSELIAWQVVGLYSSK